MGGMSCGPTQATGAASTTAADSSIASLRRIRLSPLAGLPEISMAAPARQAAGEAVRAAPAASNDRHGGHGADGPYRTRAAPGPLPRVDGRICPTPQLMPAAGSGQTRAFFDSGRPSCMGPIPVGR